MNIVSITAKIIETKNSKRTLYTIACQQIR